MEATMIPLAGRLKISFWPLCKTSISTMLLGAVSSPIFIASLHSRNGDHAALKACLSASESLDTHRQPVNRDMGPEPAKEEGHGQCSHHKLAPTTAEDLILAALFTRGGILVPKSLSSRLNKSSYWGNEQGYYAHGLN